MGEAPSPIGNHMYTFIGKVNTRLDHSTYTKISHKIYLKIVYIQSTGMIQLFNNSTGNVPSIYRYDAYVWTCSRFTVVSQLNLKTTHDVGINFEIILHEFIEIQRNAQKLWKDKIPFLVTKSGWNLESTRFMKSLEVNYMECSPLFSAYNRFWKMYNENHTFL